MSRLESGIGSPCRKEDEVREPLGMMRQCSVAIDQYECTVCIKGMYEERASNEGTVVFCSLPRDEPRSLLL